MIRLILLVLLIITPVLTGFSQVYNASDTYPNGRNKFKGKFVVCSTRDPKVPFVEIFEKRKFGKWIAYNPNGTVNEIRYYTRRGKDCKTAVKKEGEWKYFNDNGLLYLTEKYDNDTLVYSEVDVYEGLRHLGVAMRTYVGLEEIPLSGNTDTSNLIRNPSFDQYLFKPIEIINDGHDQIENLIPYWYSPDEATPDYFNDYRSVTGVPDNLHSAIGVNNGNGYVGLMLYLGEVIAHGNLVSGSDPPPFGRLSLDYKESMQAKLARTLVEHRTYCFRMKTRLSSNAGYSINKLGILFSSKPIFYNHLEEPVKASFSFSSVLNNDQQWKALCKTFVATGDEEYITLGRFSSLDETTISRHQPVQLSELDVNRSAYYLIDDLELYEVKTPEICGCNSEDPVTLAIQKPVNFELFNQDQKLHGNRFILSNILFDFDKAEIKPSFMPDLSKLLRYLKSNVSVSVTIKAFTDNEGTEEYNQKLSGKRAETIEGWLIENGISESRIFARGYGSSDPIVDNTSDANRAINRRVEIVLMTD